MVVWLLAENTNRLCSGNPQICFSTILCMLPIFVNSLSSKVKRMNTSYMEYRVSFIGP